MKADFEKGIKICARCRKELPLDMFSKNKSANDGLQNWCKVCKKQISRIYYEKTREVQLEKNRQIKNKTSNTFGRVGYRRGHHNSIKRDYELSDKEIARRNNSRVKNKTKQPCVNMQGILIWYDGELEKLNRKDYARVLAKEYNRQRNCAIRGYIAWVQPSEHFLFDFDLEWMLKENASCSYGKNKLYITKWWKGEIRHWTVNDGIWREQ